MVRSVKADCTTFFEVFLLSASQSAEYGLGLIGFRSSHILSSHLFLGLPVHLLPEIVILRAAFGNLPFCILFTCMYPLRQLHLAKFTTGDILHAISQSLVFLFHFRWDSPGMHLIMPFSATTRLSDLSLCQGPGFSPME